MSLKQRLAKRYAAIVVVCLLLLGGLAYHEFITESAMRQRLGIPELPEDEWAEFAEVFFYGMIPVVLGFGWWLMRKSLAPIDALAQGVERFHAQNLNERLPRSFRDDEVDRLATAFNSMAARLEQSFSQIREFTLHASHELKTPLTIMRAQLGTLLANPAALSAADREVLHGLLDEVQRLGKIVDSLTLLTKADSGLLPLERQPVPLDQLVREGLEDAEVLAQPQGIKVISGEIAAVLILGDRHRLRQLLLNLTDNAVKYNRPGGSITLALRQRENFAELEITNTGAGIPAELQPRIFERFVRGAEARTKAIEGCGLGLTIVQWIVQAHGGTIQIASTPGGYTTVTVRLPLLEANPAPAR